MQDNEEIDPKEIKEQCIKAKDYLIQKLKSPEFWIDNAIMITIAIIVITLVLKGHYIDTKVIEVCNGMPIETIMGAK